MALFWDYIADIPAPVRVLDIGGEENFWLQIEDDAVARGVEVTLVNLTAPKTHRPWITAVAGDARDLTQFADRSFPVVFSNSVLEHVGSFDDQARMAAEVRRIGERYFVQTPSKFSPLEPHFLLPWFALWRRSLREVSVRHFSLGWYEKQPAPWAFLHHFQLLGRREVAELFPDDEITVERWGPFPKSYMVRSRVATISG